MMTPEEELQKPFTVSKERTEEIAEHHERISNLTNIMLAHTDRLQNWKGSLDDCLSKSGHLRRLQLGFIDKAQFIGEVRKAIKAARNMLYGIDTEEGKAIVGTNKEIGRYLTTCSEKSKKTEIKLWRKPLEDARLQPDIQFSKLPLITFISEITNLDLKESNNIVDQLDKEGEEVLIYTTYPAPKPFNEIQREVGRLTQEVILVSTRIVVEDSSPAEFEAEEEASNVMDPDYEKDNSKFSFKY